MKTVISSGGSQARRMAGVGLIEVLIAVVILAFGMLGVAALQAASLRNSESALEHSQATMETYAILDAMRANLDVAKIGGYDLATFTCSAPSVGDLAATDLHDWIQSIQARLGSSACGRIVCGTGVASSECTIDVQWDDSRGTHVNSTAEATAAQTHTVSTKTKI